MSMDEIVVRDRHIGALEARISELEEALIEERANSVGSMAAMSGRLMDCIEAEKEARGQLHSEGKI